MTALFPGSFNPFTIGHLDILHRALRIFPHVVVAVGFNEHKTPPQDVEEIVGSLNSLFKDCPAVSVIKYSGLTVDAARKVDASVIIRGFRNAADAEYERLLADTNRLISSDKKSAEGIDTWLIPARPDLACISSSMVRELQHNNFDVSPFIPTPQDCVRLLNN